jgi:hypothetical protein
MAELELLRLQISGLTMSSREWDGLYLRER